MNTLLMRSQSTTDAEFLRLYNRLCVALRETPDPDGITQQVYFELLHDLPIHALEAGATALMREPGRRFFPSSTEWRTAAEEAQAEAWRRVVPVARAEPWRFDCETCGDTSWQRHDCDGSSVCGRPIKHAPHAYVTRCACWPTNPTYARHQRVGRGA